MLAIIDLIKKIEQRPGMYITRNYISCLKSFLDGWFLRGTDNTKDDEFMRSFQDYIADKYRIKTSHSWSSIILFYSQDECDALKNFFSEFNSFLIIQNIG
ncbi:MAG: hypothetical protein EAZ44_10015 [Cytophagia bacterium]|nr:MAG: hypothetical protein EAZ44_10015 [Cytophagia bacterium]TAG44156.1 MAG: hypothetical protein EAZ31_02820 [Cytophagia bacterium]